MGKWLEVVWVGCVLGGAGSQDITWAERPVLTRWMETLIYQSPASVRRIGEDSTKEQWILLALSGEGHPSRPRLGARQVSPSCVPAAPRAAAPAPELRARESVTDKSVWAL